MKTMKYIFMAGAPGSKWSSVSKNIYYSPDVDRSDYSQERTYYHDASGERQLMHLGAYFDPGMEFGKAFDVIEKFTKEQCEHFFDEPFSGEGVRIIKSHVFAHKTDFLKEHWPDCPIVLVHRENDACLGWWVRCGHFNITYPAYSAYYKDLRTMATIIAAQNTDLMHAWCIHPGTDIWTNSELCAKLGIELPPQEYVQSYQNSNVRVKVI
jgi:hypothetical protein